jgi:hypothetical protein
MCTIISDNVVHAVTLVCMYVYVSSLMCMYFVHVYMCVRFTDLQTQMRNIHYILISSFVDEYGKIIKSLVINQSGRKLYINTRYVPSRCNESMTEDE